MSSAEPVSISSSDETSRDDLALRAKRVAPFALLGLVALAYEPSLHNGLTSWDDRAFLHGPAGLAGSVWEVLGQALSGKPAELAYYPVFRLSLAADRWFWGLNPLGYHAGNLLLHAANALLVFFLGLRLTAGHADRASLRQVILATVAGALFAVHPVNVEPVAWISGRKVLLAELFALLAMLWYLRTANDTTTSEEFADGAPPRLAWSWRLLSLVSFALSLLSNALMVTLPLVMAAHDRLLRRRGWATSLLAKLDYLTLSVGALALRTTRLRIERDAVSAVADPLEWVRLAGRAFWQQMRVVVWPSDLTPIHTEMRGDPFDAASVLGIALVPLAAVALWSLRRRGAAQFFLLWFLLGLLPAFGHHIMRADRHLYFAGIGLFCLAGAAVGAGLTGARSRWRQVAAATLLATVLAASVAASRAQCRVWRDSLTLWTHAVAVHPHCWKSHEMLALALVDTGRLGEAEQHLAIALGEYPSFVSALVDLGALYAMTERPEAAVELYRRALSLAPGRVMVRHRLAVALQSLDRHAEAIAVLRDGLGRTPDDLGLMNNLAWFLATCPEEAARDAAEATRLAEAVCQATRRQQPEPLETLALAQAATGRFAEAAATAEEACRLAAARGNAALAERTAQLATASRARVGDRTPPTGETAEKAEGESPRP